jgi:hypothetical protein
MTKAPWEWWLGGVCLLGAAATHLIAALVQGTPIDALAIASLVAVPLLMLRSRATGVTDRA